MTAERAQPSDLDHAQQRMAGLEAQLCATLEETLRLVNENEHDAAIIRLDDQSRALDAVMDALARDITGIALVPEPARASRPKHLVRWIAAAVVAAVSLASGVALTRSDPLSGLASKIERADRTVDPQARLLMIEDAYASLRGAPADAVTASTVSIDLANAARRTEKDLSDSKAPKPMQQRAAVIARALDPSAPVAPQSGSGSPTQVIMDRFPRR